MTGPTTTPSRPAPQVATEPQFYADGYRVRARGKVTKHDGKIVSQGMDWPVLECEASNALSIADLMNKGDRHEGLLKALRASRDAIRKIAFVAHKQSLTNEERVSDIASVSDLALTAVEAALAIAQGAAPAGGEGSK